MEKRYQVFVSSTYQDLQEERQQVMQALLELDCIPSGMELFPAANEDQWTLIKKVIDDCDYYIAIIAGRYGSVGPEGISYTQMEYQYAVDHGKPVIAFLHKNPGELSANRTEESPEGKKKLEAFRALAQKKMVKFWDSPAELGGVVSRSLIVLKKTNPAVGWVRADRVPDESSSLEILRLKQQVEELEARLAASRTQAPEGTKDLAQGDDEVEIKFTFEASEREMSGFPSLGGTTYNSRFSTTWNTLFSRISPLMIDEASEHTLKLGLNEFIQEVNQPALSEDKKLKGYELRRFQIDDADFHTIKVQIRALGLIAKSVKQRSLKHTGTYWTLTPYGDSVMTKLRAIKKT